MQPEAEPEIEPAEETAGTEDASEVVGQKALTMTNDVRVRERASVYSPVVMMLRKDREVTILDTAEDAEGTAWYQIRFERADGQVFEGYARAELIQLIEAQEDAKNALLEQISNGKQAVTLSNNVSVYVEPTVHSERYFKLARNREVTIISEAVDENGETWYEIAYDRPIDGKTVCGFVKSKFLEVREGE